MSKQKWTFKEWSNAIADTGDYDSGISFTNGKDIFVSSSEDIKREDCIKFCELLNLMPDLWSHKTDGLEFQNNQLEEKVNHLKNALEKISSPIKFMQNELKSGEQLNGQYAIQLSNDANYLKSIAVEAIRMSEEF